MLPLQKSYFLEDVDVKNVLVSNKIFSGEKKPDMLHWLLVW